MSVTTISLPASLGSLIQESTSEADILKIIRGDSSIKLDGNFLNAKHEGFSPLVWSLTNAYYEVAKEIIRRQNNTEEFIDSFKATGELQATASSFLFLTLDLDKNSFPEPIKKLIEELDDMKMAALLTESAGKADFYGIPWDMQGHHNYCYVSKKLFESISKNEENIQSAIKADDTFQKLSDNQKKQLKESIESSITLMLAIHTPSFSWENKHARFTCRRIRFIPKSIFYGRAL